ncbi:unnamed protein product [Cuscuta europaea]|uniref:Uncharacterized protein n=1 Tax=Cuscuta europaea TaxID=41803 RepID=A0A9P0ZFT5_CUSEU|nr:unnamed protein product [Cuscuta europaea]
MRRSKNEGRRGAWQLASSRGRRCELRTPADLQPPAAPPDAVENSAVFSLRLSALPVAPGLQPLGDQLTPLWTSDSAPPVSRFMGNLINRPHLQQNHVINLHRHQLLG